MHIRWRRRFTQASPSPPDIAWNLGHTSGLAWRLGWTSQTLEPSSVRCIGFVLDFRHICVYLESLANADDAHNDLVRVHGGVPPEPRLYRGACAAKLLWCALAAAKQSVVYSPVRIVPV